MMVEWGILSQQGKATIWRGRANDGTRVYGITRTPEEHPPDPDAGTTIYDLTLAIEQAVRWSKEGKT